jgi:FkbM family methyltransferase
MIQPYVKLKPLLLHAIQKWWAIYNEPTMRKFLVEKGFQFDGDYLHIPEKYNRVKIDVGLSVNAPQSAIWLSRDPKLFIFGFEPVSQNIQAIKRGDSKWPINLDPTLIDKRFKIIPCALGSSVNFEGQKMFVTLNDPGCSSLLKPTSFEVAYEETVPVYTLDAFLNYFPFHKIPIIDHLKIDVQGMDLAVLKGARKYLNKFLAVTIEIDLAGYQNSENSLREIKSILQSEQFKTAPTTSLGRNKLRIQGLNIDFQVDDPTFFHKQNIKVSKKRRVEIFQRG